MVMVNGKWQEKNQREFLPNLFALVSTMLSQVYTTLSIKGSDAEITQDVDADAESMEGTNEARVKLIGAYAVDYYLLAAEDLKESKTNHRELKNAVVNVIMAGETKPKKFKLVKTRPPPMRLTRSTAAKNITEIRQEIAALPKDGKEMAAMKASKGTSGQLNETEA